jgi:hypothetical protein
MQTMFEMMADYDAERIREIERQEARDARPERQAMLAAKKARELATQARNRRHAARSGRADLSTWGIA